MYALDRVIDQPIPTKKDISVDPLIFEMDHQLGTRANLSKSHEFAIEKFWQTSIDFEDEHISKNYSPFLVMLETPMAKIHFLFTMLNINMLLVMERGLIMGIITKLEFIQKRKSDDH